MGEMVKKKKHRMGKTKNLNNSVVHNLIMALRWREKQAVYSFRPLQKSFPKRRLCNDS